MLLRERTANAFHLLNRVLWSVRDQNLIDLFIPFLHIEEDNLYLQDNQHTVPLSPFTFHDKLAKLLKTKTK